MQRWFTTRGESYWTRTNIVLLAIAVEHMIIGLKIVIGVLIPDIPKDVKESELRRSSHEQQAKELIDETIEIEQAKIDKQKERKEAGSMS